MKVAQSTSSILMIPPTSFGYDEQTAKTNDFQKRIKASNVLIRKRANKEFNTVVDGLRDHQIFVIIAAGKDSDPPRPNAVFPNNWVSFWPNGQVFLYPMANESRRAERSYGVLDILGQRFKINQVNDMSTHEANGKFLESTGVMIFDHIHKIVYGCISARCDGELFRAHARELGYQPMLFHAYHEPGKKIYHTNIALSIQRTTAVICADVITNKAERTKVLNSLANSGHELVIISSAQMESYCGNVLEICNSRGKHFLVMSQTAFDAFSDEQRTVLSQDKKILAFNITTIETIGGGSMRCMLAEIFLPKL